MISDNKYTYICDNCGEALYAYPSRNNKTVIVVLPCEQCSDEEYSHGKIQGYLEGNIDNLFNTMG